MKINDCPIGFAFTSNPSDSTCCPSNKYLLTGQAATVTWSGILNCNRIVQVNIDGTVVAPTGGLYWSGTSGPGNVLWTDATNGIKARIEAVIGGTVTANFQHTPLPATLTISGLPNPGTRATFKGTTPCVIPQNRFELFIQPDETDLKDVLLAEAIALDALNDDGPDTKYIFVGTGTEENPDFVFSLDKDGTMVCIEGIRFVPPPTVTESSQAATTYDTTANPDPIAPPPEPIFGSVHIEQYKNGRLISFWDGFTWLNTFVADVPTVTYSDETPGNYADAGPVSAPAKKIFGSVHTEDYSDGTLVSFWDGTAWINIFVPTTGPAGAPRDLASVADMSALGTAELTDLDGSVRFVNTVGLRFVKVSGTYQPLEPLYSVGPNKPTEPVTDQLHYDTVALTLSYNHPISNWIVV